MDGDFGGGGTKVVVAAPVYSESKVLGAILRLSHRISKSAQKARHSLAVTLGAGRSQFVRVAHGDGLCVHFEVEVGVDQRRVEADVTQPFKNRTPRQRLSENGSLVMD